MKKSIGLITGLLMVTGLTVAQELPQPSPLAKIEQRVGLTDISLEYSRPSAKDRVIFGDLVPFDAMYRTGANASTKISFSTDVVFGGRKVPAGKYALYTIPGKTEWTVILHKNTTFWGVGEYKEEEDLIRINVKSKEVPMTETLTIELNNFKKEMADLTIRWEKTAVTVTVNCNSVEQSKTNIISKLDEIENAYSVYNKASRYYLDTDLDVNQALIWAKKSTNIEEKFWNVYTLSLAYAANNDFKNAIAAAKKSKKLAMEANYQQYVNMNDDNVASWKTM
ncbi:MAG: hypothetical protein ACJAUV_001350 [Flavobacteriales bacterium]|jgi:hypothetical protein